MAVEFGIVGRIVFGHPAKEQPVTDNEGKPRIGKDGKPRTAWTFGLAVSMEDFQNIAWPQMYQEAASLFGANVNANPKFAWKIKRDTDLDSKGQPYSTHEGRAGVITMTLSTEAFAPPCFKRLPNGSDQQIEPKEIKCGDYVYVSIACKANKPDNPTHSPSLYMNPLGVLLVGYGTEIVGTSFDAKTGFAGFKGVLPPGASLQPVAPANAGMGMPGVQHAAPVQQYAQPAPAAYAAAPAPMAAPAPHHGFVNGAVGQPMPGAAPMPGMMPPPGFPAPGQ